MSSVDALNGVTIPHSTSGWSWRNGAALTCLLALFLFLQSFLPLSTAILIGSDEGFEVAKATLSLKGYKLYTDIWNDQPPLHTFLLTETIRHFSSTMLGPRLMTSGFAMLLLTSVYLLCWRLSGSRVAILATLLLLCSPGFLLLASSCMLEIPALAPTMAALCVLALGNRSRWPAAEMVAGALLGIALEIKMISLMMLPMAVLLVWLNQRQNPSPVRSSSKRLVVLLICLGASTVAADLVAGGGAYLMHFRQSWVSHFGGMKSHDYGSPNGFPFDWAVLLRNWDLSLPAALGVVVCLGRVSGALSAAVPLAWLTYNLLVLGLHRPWWNYYYVHTAFPLSWCAAIGIDAMWAKARWPQGRLWCALLGLYVLCSGVWLEERLSLEIQSVRRSPQTYSCLFLKEMERYKPQTKWLYAEEPIYSFHAGIPLPPDLGVVVLKRYWSGEMTTARLTEDLRSIKPEMMLLRNNTRLRPFRDLINDQYQLIYMDPDHLLYVLKSIAKTSKHEIAMPQLP
jgi:hypothetical protein